MPYEGEYAGYRALQRVAEAERVRQLLTRARVRATSRSETAVSPHTAPKCDSALPDFAVAIDGSPSEVDVRNGYPGAKIGYLSVASVLLDLKAIDALDEHRPADPVAFRATEKAATIDAALPGCNVVTRAHASARQSFREEVFDVFQSGVVDTDDVTPLLDTYEALLALKPRGRPQECPYRFDTGCNESLLVSRGVSSCNCSRKRAIWSTDALRCHEAFRDAGSNGEAFGEVLQVWERVLLVHLLRAFERRGLLASAHRLAFFLDGPLALFGHPAWLSAAISTELKRLNAVVRGETGCDLVIIGIEKSGAFVTHFEELDRSEVPGVSSFAPREFLMLSDEYIKKCIIFSESEKRYGLDTYFGRKFYYKTASGARIVASIPFLDGAQDSLETTDAADFRAFPIVCALLDKLVSVRYQNALSPIVSAHAQASIPLHLGARVLEQLAKALMRAV